LSTIKVLSVDLFSEILLVMMIIFFIIVYLISPDHPLSSMVAVPIRREWWFLLLRTRWVEWKIPALQVRGNGNFDVLIGLLLLDFYWFFQDLPFPLEWTSIYWLLVIGFFGFRANHDRAKELHFGFASLSGAISINLNVVVYIKKYLLRSLIYTLKSSGML
jgi:hypothetical protein